jgi:hypothetical protein
LTCSRANIVVDNIRRRSKIKKMWSAIWFELQTLVSMLKEQQVWQLSHAPFFLFIIFLQTFKKN